MMQKHSGRTRPPRTPEPLSCPRPQRPRWNIVAVPQRHQCSIVAAKPRGRGRATDACGVIEGLTHARGDKRQPRWLPTPGWCPRRTRPGRRRRSWCRWGRRCPAECCRLRRCRYRSGPGGGGGGAGPTARTAGTRSSSASGLTSPVTYGAIAASLQPPGRRRRPAMPRRCRRQPRPRPGARPTGPAAARSTPKAAPSCPPASACPPARYARPAARPSPAAARP